MPVVGFRGDKIITRGLEYNLTEHCNYACDQCSHLSPYMKRRESALESFRRDLSALASVMQVKRFTFVGGEPLLHKQILPHIRAVRDSGISQEIQISTNGSRIDTTPLDVFSEIDVLRISWYSDARCDSAKIKLAEEICKRAGTQLIVNRVAKFRQMEVGHIKDDHLVNSIYKTCEIAHIYYGQTFYDGRFYLCSRPIFSQNYLQRIGIPAPDFKELDGVPLHAPLLKERLLKTLSSTAPTAACSYCLGTVGRKMVWRSLDPSERKSPALPSIDPLERISRRRLRFLQVRRALSLNHYLLFRPLLLLVAAGVPAWWRRSGRRRKQGHLVAGSQSGRLATGIRRSD
jgi:organic radical activating enzyme